MDGAQLPELARQWANDLLVWIGFGTLVGLIAKAIMPGRDPGGAIVTLLLGIGGTIIGLGTLMFFWRGHRVTPISAEGFVVATLGAFLLLFFYRMLAGRLFTEGADGRPQLYRRPRRVAQRGIVIHEEAP